MSKVKKLSDLYKLSRAAGEFFVTQSQEAILSRGRFSVALSGGETPASLYSLLASEAYRSRIEWDKVFIFWGDERCVPPSNVESNYNMAQMNLLNHIQVPPDNIYRIQGELKPEKAAEQYEQQLSDFFGTGKGNPRFDLVLLGLGSDGHTASLFPHSDALYVKGQWVTANFVEDLRSWRVTLTAEALNAAANVVFLVSGEGKAKAVQAILEDEYQPETYPAQLIDPRNGNLVWLLDQSAASLLHG